MNAITLKSLGFSKEDLQERVIDRLCGQILSGKSFDTDSQFKKQLEERLRKHVTETINVLAEKHVLPNVTQYIEKLVLQTTNKWGEKTGTPVTFIEYLVQRAEAYIQEDVDFQGKGKGANSYNWSKNTTRIAYMINQHLQHNINIAMTQALVAANQSIVGGIEKAVRIQLEQIVGTVKASVSVKG